MAQVSTFMGLQTALRGLLAQQQALDVTSHNISNANTVGYSRQEAVLSPTDALQVVQDGTTGALGTGVAVTDYRRIRDTFLDLQYRAQAMRLGDLGARSRSLDQVELALAEPGPNGISAQLEKLWSRFADLGNSPDSLATRQALVEHARGVAASFAALDGQLATVAAQAASEYAQITASPGGEVAQIADEISRLNAAIKSAVGAGSQPNDLLDRRDLLLDRLSGLGQVSVTDLANGSITVRFGGTATPLVNDTTVTWPQTLATPGGKLGALLDISSATGPIAAYRADLNTSARALADSINALHNGGTGTDFYTYVPGSEAASLTVAVAPSAVRAGSTGASGANDIARAISRLRGTGADSTSGALVTRIGNGVRDVSRGEANSQVLLDAVKDRRDSTSGVSMDEEMTNLIRFQRGYQASARAMSTLDEALDVLINRTGRVGL